jgi:hypothetical protein
VISTPDQNCLITIELLQLGLIVIAHPHQGTRFRVFLPLLIFLSFFSETQSTLSIRLTRFPLFLDRLIQSISSEGVEGIRIWGCLRFYMILYSLQSGRVRAVALCKGPALWFWFLRQESVHFCFIREQVEFQPKAVSLSSSRS